MSTEDDRWAINRLPKDDRSGSIASGSYRYADVNGVVHRAYWQGTSKWQALCGSRVVEKLQENDPGAITCIGCLGEGA